MFQNHFEKTASPYTAEMAAVVALGTSLVEGPVNLIFAFLDESSVAGTCGSNVTDIANLSDVEESHITETGFGYAVYSANVIMQEWLYNGSLHFPHRP